MQAFHTLNFIEPPVDPCASFDDGADPLPNPGMPPVSADLNPNDQRACDSAAIGQAIEREDLEASKRSENSRHSRKFSNQSSRNSKIQVDDFGLEKPPLRYIQLVGDYPLSCMCGWCCSCCVFLGLVVVSASSLYVSFTNFPFYVKGNIWYEKQEALHQAKLDAPDAPFGLGDTSSKPGAYKGRQFNLFKLRIIYEPPSGEDIWSLENMQKIAELEDEIIKAKAENSKKEEKSYSDYCQIIYNATSEKPMEQIDAYTASPCRTPLSPIAFLWDKWMPIPYNGIDFPTAMWVQPGNSNLSQCYLPLVTSPTPFTPGDPYGYLQTFMPPTITAEKFVEHILDGEPCKAAKHVMPHTMVTNTSCPVFDLCYALLFNTVSIQSWGNSLNWMWNYADVASYHQQTYSRFLDYWSTYGSNESKYFSTEAVNTARGAYAPFLYARVELSKDGTRREMHSDPMQPLIRYVADRSFGFPSYGRSGKAVMSTFYFGGPLSNIDKSWTQIGGDDSQGGESSSPWTTDFGTWAFNAYHDLLMKRNEDGKVKITWRTLDVKVSGFDPMKNIYIVNNILPKDMMLLIGSFFFVFLYIAAVKRSFFLASLGMAMVLLTAIPSMALYVLVLRQTFVGILQMLSMFIIMGIGADGVFVLLDCYEADRHYCVHELKNDLSAAWRSAAKATLATSVTTFFSFLSNAGSPFPAISTFGLWCCCLIAVNYVSVHTFYLSVLSIYDRYFALKRVCCLGNNARANQAVLKSGGVENKTHGGHGDSEFKGIPLFIASKCYPLIWKARYPLALLWLLLTIFYAVCALHLEPDPNAPNILPDDDPYGQWNDRVIEHFGSLDNPYRITVELVLGINRNTPLNRDGTDPVKPTDRGKVNWVNMDPGNDANMIAYQRFMVDLCEDLEAKASRSPGVDLEGLSIASHDEIVGEKVVDCPVLHFKSWIETNGYSWPLLSWSQWVDMVGTYFREPDTEDSRKTNYDRWRDTLFFVENASDPIGITVKLQTVRVILNAQSNMLFSDGLKLTEKWEDYTGRWRPRTPIHLRDGFFFTDGGAFHWFVSQNTITSECYKGMALALSLSYVVLIIASGNIVVATFAIACIASIVTSVVAFAVWNGWRLGMLEAIIFVMVIGMSVDYVVHMADAYLESTHSDRPSRTRFMMGKMAMSVISGAVTTLGSSTFMVFAHITFFKKFGLIILFTVFQSCLTALIFFAALMACFGPEGTRGDIPFDRCLRLCKRRGKHESASDPKPCNNILPEKTSGNESGTNAVGTLGKSVSEKSVASIMSV